MGSMNWMNLALDMDQYGNLVNMNMNHIFPQNYENLLVAWHLLTSEKGLRH